MCSRLTRGVRRTQGQAMLEVRSLFRRVVADDGLALALEGGRELARGLHPAVLTDLGLRAAVESLAARSPVPVETEAVPEERLPEPVEAAAYYLIANTNDPFTSSQPSLQTEFRMSLGSIVDLGDVYAPTIGRTTALVR